MLGWSTCHIYLVERRANNKMGALRVPDDLDPSRMVQRSLVQSRQGFSAQDHNTNQQLSESLRATSLCFPVLWAAITLDINLLHSNIRSGLSSNPTIWEHLSNPSGHWSMDPDGYLRLNSWIYVLDVNNLRLRVLQYKHDHPISRHFGQNQTMDLVRHDYVWPELRNSIKLYIKSCTTCMHSKSQRHHPYGLLKQLPIPKHLWNSISMDFIEKLPRSSRFDTILVIVNRFTKEDVQIDNQPQNLKKYQMYFKRRVIILTLGVYNLNDQNFFECLQTFWMGSYILNFTFPWQPI